MATSGTFANAQFFLEYRPFIEDTQFWGASPGFEWQLSDTLRMDLSLNKTRSWFHRESPTVLVNTPAGSAPMNGTTFHAQESIWYEQKTPQWAIVVAIVGLFFICLFSLFFLMAKENVAVGYIDVTVVNGQFTHTTRVSIANQFQADLVRRQIADAQHMASVAPAAG